MSTSFNRLLQSSRLATPARALLDIVLGDRSIRTTRPDRERLDGKVNKSSASQSGSRPPSFGTSTPKHAGNFRETLASRLKTRAPRAKPSSARASATEAPMDFDKRQRAVMKIHYFNHSGGGGAGLKAHARYVERHGAQRDAEARAEADRETPPPRRREERDQAEYLTRKDRGVFYDATEQGVDGGSRIETWAKSDRRHFRLILSAEEAAQLKDLQAYTREVMERAGKALDTKLSWVAVDHHDTDNPHTHIILRGRRANGQDLILPKDFIKHGFRSIARDVASETLGARTPEQEIYALERDARRCGPSRLDWRIAQSATGRWEVAIDALHAKDNDPAVTRALRQRLLELEKLQLAKQIERGFFQLAPDWRDRLKAMELHIDIRKRVMREQVERSAVQQQVTRDISRGGLER